MFLLSNILQRVVFGKAILCPPYLHRALEAEHTPDTYTHKLLALQECMFGVGGVLTDNIDGEQAHLKRNLLYTDFISEEDRVLSKSENLAFS